MSWVQNLYDTYCACEDAVGICKVNNQAQMLLPIGHILIEPDYIIRLWENGTLFDTPEKVPHGKNDPKLLYCAPRTDDSEGRSSRSAGDFPHPLFDQLKYLLNANYISNLSKWIEFLRDKTEYGDACTALGAVISYISKGTLKKDVPKAKEKDVIFFCVNIKDKNEDRLWCMPELWRAWIDYHGSLSAESDVCYITGETLPFTDKNPKVINRSVASAKIISGNDSTNFTYRGRFEAIGQGKEKSYKQAVTVSYDASQKMHQALRWLIATRGTHCNTQAVVAWAIDKDVEIEKPLDDTLGIYKKLKDPLLIADSITDLNYSLAYRKAALGSGNADRLKDHTKRIAVLAVDATTAKSGRLSVTYCCEMQKGEYQKRIANWHEQCAWYQPFDDKDDKIVKGYFIGAPSANRIVTAILGKKPKKSESYDKLAKGIHERLLHCIMDGERIPRDMVDSVLHRASNPLALEEKDPKKLTGTDSERAYRRWRDWEEALSVACGLWRRHYKEDKEKGDEYQLALEENRTDRDYLYGRLLAVADKLEQYALYEGEKERSTKAMQYMQVFSQQPYRVWKNIEEQLSVYITKLGGKATWYREILDEVNSKFEKGDFEKNEPLKGAYLLGYHCQRKRIEEIIEELKNKKKQKEENTNESGEQN